MLLFRNNLIASKTQSSDGDNIVAQKTALKTLSKQEKLLLVELQRTRQNIIAELGKLDPAIAVDNWTDVNETIGHYKRKLLDDVDTGKSLPTINKHSKSSTNLLSQSNVSTIRTTSRGNTGQIRTGIDMLPVLASTAESALAVGLRKQRPLKLPIFKLPTVDATHAAVLARTIGSTSEIVSGNSLRIERRVVTASLPTKSYLGTLVHLIRQLTKKERRFMRAHLGLIEADFGAFEMELKRTWQLENPREDESIQHLLVNSHHVSQTSVFLHTKSIVLAEALAAATIARASISEAIQSSEHTAQLTTGTVLHTSGTHQAQVSSHAKSLGTQMRSCTGTAHAALDTCSLSLSQSSCNSTSLAHSKVSAARHTTRHAWGTGGSAGAGKVNQIAMGLQTELLQSLRAMQNHTDKLKEGIVGIQDLVQFTNPKARAYMLVMAGEQMQKALWRCVSRVLVTALRAWVLAVRLMRNEAKIGLFTQFLGYRNIAMAACRVVNVVLSKKMGTWINFTQMETLRLRRIRQRNAAIRIQSLGRGYIARVKVAARRQRSKYQAMYDATIKIQALIRGTGVRWKYLNHMRRARELRSVRLLQRVQRGHRARRRVRAIKLQIRKTLCAVTIQRVARGRQGRKRIAKLKKAREMGKYAKKIQKIVRGFLGRRRVKNITLNRHKWAAAIRIQARMRGCIARMNLGRKRLELTEMKSIRDRAVNLIQKTYRGYRGRLLSRMYIIEMEKRKRKIFVAATLINNMVRGFLSRKYYQKLLKEQMQSWLVFARSWKEVWSEDAKAFFYLHEASGDTLWEPAKGGYTKATGELVLANGTVVEDMRYKYKGGEDAEEDEEDNSDLLCSECNERIAIRKCEECGDKFCTKCYKYTHATGSRRKHTFSNIGPIDCTECENVLAEKWCVSCDEAYCEVCWKKVHSKGKRRFHPFCEVSTTGKIDHHIFTTEGEEVHDYDSAYVQQVPDNDGAANQGADDYNYPTGDGGEWTQAYDDDGNAYWYNNLSGESQYENPYES